MVERPFAYPTARTATAPSGAWSRARPAVAARAGGLAYGLLYLPFIIAWVTVADPVVSYGTAWLGSWWILWVSMSGRVKPLPGGGGIREQIMRPVVFTQVVFAGYMALTSIFFALDQIGIRPEGVSGLALPGSFELLASAQRLYLLGHAAFVTGVLLLLDDRRSGEWRVVMKGSLSRALLMVTAATFIGALAFRMLPGLGQVSIRLSMISLVASVLALATAFPERRPGALALGMALYTVNLGQAFLSGWKEEVLILILLLGVFAYPYYRAAVLLAMPVALGAFLVLMPTYNQTFRELNWQGETGAQGAAVLSFKAVASAGRDDLRDNTWRFLTGRLSEIGLFQDYLTHTPHDLPFWGMSLAGQAAAMTIPRIVWPEKPNVETVVMDRVYANGVTDASSSISAKPQFVVDGYLSFGALGVWLSCLIYGLTAAWASRLSERWFGGYLIGSALVYTSLFQILWRGNCFEFVVNTVVWSFVILWALFTVGLLTGRIVRA